MRERMVELARRRWVAWSVLGLAAALGVGLIAAAANSEPKTVHDCFGGALSQDPVHCAVLQGAHNEGIVEVDAVYRAGTSLYLYLRQRERASDEVYDYIKSKAREEVERGGGRACRYGINGCDVGILRGGLLPVSKVYSDIELRPGGARARRTHRGWASYRELWPSRSIVPYVDEGGTTVPGSFDVSDVDRTRFPEFEGGWSERYPGLGIAGWNSGGGKAYVQVKAPPGQEAKATAAKEAVLRKNLRLNEDTVVIIPVKYDYEELWRWSVVLDRFAYAPGNTIGIRWSKVGENWEAYAGGGEAVYPLPEVPEAVRRPELGVRSPADERTTIHVSTYDLERTVKALPVLLPQLGIPVDAVGVVVQHKPSPFSITIPGAASHTEPAQGEEAAVTDTAAPKADGTAAATESASEGGNGTTPDVSSPAEAVQSEVDAGNTTESGSNAAATESASEVSDETAPLPAQGAEPPVSERGDSPWLLVSVALAGALCVVVFVGVRLARRRV